MTLGSHSPLASVWERLRPPIRAEASVVALLGVTERTAAGAVGVSLAASPEATELVSRVPRIIRELSISTVAVPERTTGGVRGPILWSETIAARSASAGDPNVFVCATMARAHDTPENRLLVAALVAIRDAAAAARRQGGHDGDVERARRNGEVAARFLDHRIFVGVEADQIRRGATARLRRGRRRNRYAAVADVLHRVATPPAPQPSVLAADLRTTAQLQLLAAVADHAQRRGVRLRGFRVDDHRVHDGPVGFRHPRHQDAHAPAGVWLGRTVLDVPSTVALVRGVQVVHNRADIVDAVERALLRGDL